MNIKRERNDVCELTTDEILDLNGNYDFRDREVHICSQFYCPLTSCEDCLLSDVMRNFFHNHQKYKKKIK